MPVASEKILHMAARVRERFGASGWGENYRPPSPLACSATPGDIGQEWAARAMGCPSGHWLAPDPCRSCNRRMCRRCDFEERPSGGYYVDCIDCREAPPCSNADCTRMKSWGAAPIWELRREGRRLEDREYFPGPRAEGLDRPNFWHQALTGRAEVDYRGWCWTCINEAWVMADERQEAERQERLAAQRAARKANPPEPGGAWAASARRRLSEYGWDSEVHEFTWAEVVERQGSESCAICEQVDDLVLDHITPLAAAGSHTLDNVRLLCAPCNGWKVAEIDRPLIEAARALARRHEMAA